MILALLQSVFRDLGCVSCFAIGQPLQPTKRRTQEMRVSAELTQSIDMRRISLQVHVGAAVPSLDR